MLVLDYTLSASTSVRTEENKSGQQEKLNYSALTTAALGEPTECSGSGITLQSWSRLRKGNWVLTFHINQSLDVGCLCKSVMALGKIAFSSQGHLPERN